MNYAEPNIFELDYSVKHDLSVGSQEVVYFYLLLNETDFLN